jgi:4-hydroxybenzoyl-CoA reductase subunit beta
MRLPYFDFFEPATLPEMLTLMERYGEKVRPHAGGTALLPLIRLGLLRPSGLVGLGKLRGLKGIDRRGEALHIGAMTTLSELAASPAVRKDAAGLHDAVLSVAVPPIRTMATIGGNIFQDSRCLFYNQSAAWRLERQPCLKAGGKMCLALNGSRKCFSVYQGDLAPALIALGARVRLEKKGGEPREVPVEELFTGQGRRPVRPGPGEVATEIIVPIVRDTGSSYKKLRLRSAVDYPLAGASAFVAIKGGTIEIARLVLSAAGPAPVAVPLDGLVSGKKPSAVDLDAVGRSIPKNLPLVNNQIVPASYRRKMLAVFAKRAMKAALERV